MLSADVTTFGNPGSTEWLDYAKTLLVLSGICGLAIAIIRIWIPKLRRVNTFATDHIELLARFQLEPRKSLYIVKAGRMAVLLATSENGIHFMTSLDPQDFAADVTLSQANVRQPSVFARLMRPAKPEKEETSQ